MLCCRALQEFQDVVLAKQMAKLDETQERVTVAADKVPLVVRRAWSWERSLGRARWNGMLPKTLCSL